MRYQQDMQLALRERYKRLMVADYATAGQEVVFAAGWIERQPVLRGILAEAEHAEPDLDFDSWEKNLASAQVFSWACRTEEGRATLAWKLMQQLASAGADAARDGMFNYGHRIDRTRSSSLDSSNRALVETVFSPLFDFLGERVGAESSVLYMLERYVRRIEWFDRDELYARYSENTRKGEEIYDRDLRKFLFSEGINMPFAQAKSASGLSDVLSELDTDDPLVCELKIFDGEDRGKRHLAAGVNQAVQYAQDHGKTVAYLVIINLSGRALELPSDEATATWPPRLELAGVRVYLIAVRALPPASASKLGKAAPVTITRADLITRDAAGDDTITV